MTDDIKIRVIEAATDLFGQRGYGSASVRELVEAAQITKPTLYHHFGNKEGLFIATAKHHLVRLDDLAREALEADGTLQHKLERLVAAKIQFSADHPNVLRFLITCLHQVDHGQPTIDMMSIDATLVRYLGAVFLQASEAGELRDEIDIPIAVINFLGILRAWSLAAFHGAPIPVDVHTPVVHHFLSGIRAL